MSANRPNGEQGREPRRAGGFVGMGGLAVVLFLVLASATTFPWWVATAQVVLWLVLFALACRWFVRRPGLVPVLPVVALAVWVGAVVLFAPRR